MRSDLLDFAAFISAWNELRPRIECHVRRLDARQSAATIGEFQRLMDGIEAIISRIASGALAPPDAVRDACVFVLRTPGRDVLAHDIWALVGIYRRAFADSRPSCKLSLRTDDIPR